MVGWLFGFLMIMNTHLFKLLLPMNRTQMVARFVTSKRVRLIL